MEDVPSHMTFSCWLCFLSLLCINSFLSVTASSRNESDLSALVGFKYQINDDPSGILNAWNHSLHHCEWQGITCHRDRVTVLDLGSRKLGGTLSPYIGNLTFLTNITLTENNFHGQIPQEIGRLVRLQHLSVSSNSFNGEIPSNLTRCTDLRLIDLMDNELSGKISSEFSSLTKLLNLLLAINNLTGSIPPSLGNLSSLTQLSLLRNNLEGIIPAELCYLQSLRDFRLSSNNLAGKLPHCLYNHSNIDAFAVANNKLEGTLPPNIGLTLPNIREFYLGLNIFAGLIPISLTNATRLEVIALYGNSFIGSVPRDLGRLQGLRKVYFHKNQLGTKDRDDLHFITSLTNCSNLEVVEFDKNFLKGPLPDSISNLSKKITYLNAGENRIHGKIPVGIENLVNIERLHLQENHIAGNIPVAIGKLSKLFEIYLQGNILSGQIPASLGNLTQLTHLELGANHLSGSIPPTLRNCHNLLLLNLSHNNLIGRIPPKVVGLSSIAIGLYLQQNSLTGSLPSQVGKLTSSVALDVSGNQLSGQIPESLGYCLYLKYLSMHGNSFEGKIPMSLSSLSGLEYLDLSSNNLSGEIPEYLERFPLLELNLSFNQLEGQVPGNGIFRNTSLFSVHGNKNLCGGMVELKLPACKRNTSVSIKVIIPAIVGSICLIVLSCIFLLCYRKTKSQRNSSSTTSFDQQYMRVTYAELHRATNGFSTDNLIGFGSYGSVFKGILQEINKTVAVKVFNLHRQGASKSFLTECNALRNLRHRNLLKIITSCSSVDFQRNDFKALVFEFMPNGSLEEWLHQRLDEKELESRYLNFNRRLNIAIDVASALEYLHHHSEPSIVHCDLKPSNVLLDKDMIAHVADFGIAKIFSVTPYNASNSEISSVLMKGSIGYIAPEYGIGGEVSIQGDVYSYGILLLEMFTRKKPTDDMFSDGLCLHNYAEIALHDKVMEIVDPMVLSEENGKLLAGDYNTRERLQECLDSIIRLGVACSAESALQRMTMKEVITELHHIREHHQCRELLGEEVASVKLI